MTGFGGMVSFELAGTVDEVVVVRFVAALLRSRREPRWRQVAALPPGADDARVDPGGGARGPRLVAIRWCGSRPAANIAKTWSPICSKALKPCCARAKLKLRSSRHSGRRRRQRPKGQPPTSK